MRELLAIIIAYLLGSIPFGYLLGRGVKGLDIRQTGSGNVGATNALRTLGWKLGLATFLLDFLKGFLTLWIADRLQVSAWAFAVSMLVVELGHCYSLFLHFTGGKGVATGAGLLTYLHPTYLALSLLLFLLLVKGTGYVSLASMVASSFALLAVLFFSKSPLPIKLAVFLVVVLILYRHQSNIDRLRKGKERKIGENRGADHS